jgi:hypothetical protein
MLFMLSEQRVLCKVNVKLCSHNVGVKKQCLYSWVTWYMYSLRAFLFVTQPLSSYLRIAEFQHNARCSSNMFLRNAKNSDISDDIMTALTSSIAS